MKKAYTTPRAYKLNYEYDEQVTAISAVPSYSGRIGTIFEGYDYCQMGVDSAGFTTCKYYFTTADVDGKCTTDQMPMRLFR